LINLSIVVIMAKSVTNLSGDLVPKEQVMGNFSILGLSRAIQGEIVITDKDNHRIQMFIAMASSCLS